MYKNKLVLFLISGARSVSCMDLTAGVSSALLSSGLLPLENKHTPIQRKSNTLVKDTKNFKPKENIYEELKTPVSTLNNNKMQLMKTASNSSTHRTSTMKIKGNRSLISNKSAMKKGISEPNLAKTKSSSSTFFSPRNLIDRFKRILPLSLSKQSLNEKSFIDANGMNIDSDDSASTTSENNDDIRTSRLDHVSRVKNVYDTLGMYKKVYFSMEIKEKRSCIRVKERFVSA